MLPVRKIVPKICILAILFITNTMVSQNRIASNVDFNYQLNNFQSLVWNNSAMLYFYNDSSYSDVSLQYGQQRANGLHQIEIGDAINNLSFDASSFKKRKKSVVVGRAQYQNSKSKNILWNNVADYNLVAPYVVADTIGGTSMSELYAFEGAYCFKKGQYIYGIKAFYRASEEYRQLDPRPKSTVSNLELNVGASVAITLKYRLGFSAAYQNYQQDHYIEALRPGTGIKIFYLRGFGISDESFSSVITDSNSASDTYEQKGHTLGIQLLPINESGIFSSVQYTHAKLELQDSNYDIINHLLSNKWSMELGKAYVKNRKITKVKAYLNYHNKNGSEYNYNRNRLLLSVIEKYSSTLVDGGISYIALSTKKKNHYFYQSSLGYCSNISDYKAAIVGENPLQNIKKVYLGLTGGLKHRFSKSVLSIKLNAKYENCLHKKIITSNLAVQSANETLVISNYKYLSANQFLLTSNIRYDLDTNKIFGIYFRAKQFSMLFKNSQPYYGLSMSVGLTF